MLFVPGDSDKKAAKAAGSGADLDAVIRLGLDGKMIDRPSPHRGTQGARPLKNIAHLELLV